MTVFLTFDSYGKTPWEKYKKLESQILTVEEVHLNYHLARKNFIPQSYVFAKNTYYKKWKVL